MEYYIARNGKAEGPYDLPSLASRIMRPDTLVWCSRLPRWTPAASLPELRHFAPQPPAWTAPPPPAPIMPAPARSAEPEFSTGTIFMALFAAMLSGMIMMLTAIITAAWLMAVAAPALIRNIQTTLYI